ncbi:Stp1/IreP family PP2C-type Ser/Thr phosphatase [bacterium]|nr:Stp1/IreP family PP2C-type Ser/Thr phosphatase [bacterium]
MSDRLTITFCGCSHTGLVRAENQDAYGKFPKDSKDLMAPLGQLFVVADGMGGHQGGQEASQMAVRIIQQVYASATDLSIPERLKNAFKAANDQILQHAHRNPQLQGMGTTCTALVLKDRQAYLAHVGDSRAYLINHAGIKQLTQDHSYVAEMQRQGILTAQEAKSHPQRSVLNRALGVKPTEDIDLIEGIMVEPDDHFLLCSDGLSTVSEKELYEVVMSNPPEAACNKLVQLANEMGGGDNVTNQIIRIEG